MKLRILTPLAIVVDTPVDGLRAQDASGAFGILPGHVPFVTAVSVSIVSWHTAGAETFCAVRGGVLTVMDGQHVDIASREAVMSRDLATLDAQVLTRFRQDEEQERVEHVEAMRLQMSAIRQMINRLHATRGAESFR
ncbi:MAG: F-type H+-transporting ATPase subunit epsilon [Paracoccaceae bacterium]|jgi:F-type H+-transporting ATPase subunit epsilon